VITPGHANALILGEVHQKVLSHMGFQQPVAILGEDLRVVVQVQSNGVKPPRRVLEHFLHHGRRDDLSPVATSSSNN